MSQPAPNVSGKSKQRDPVSARTRVTISVLMGVCVAAIAGFFGYWNLTPLIAWDVAAMVYVVWIGKTVLVMDEQETDEFATWEDPGRGMADILLLGASASSLLAVAFVLVQASKAEGVYKDVLVGLAVLSIVISWVTVHTLFTLRYARIYHTEPRGGVDFNEEGDPNYMDFAYLAFTIGMTYQVSDTSLTTKELRAAALQHALWSYVFGTAIVATTVNLLAGLNK